MYKIDSQKAEEFICHEEILDTLEYAQSKSQDKELIRSIIEKARLCKGLSHREAAVLLECNDPELVEEIYRLAREIKQKFYGNRIVMFAPLYLSNYCVNSCTYCPYHVKNKTIARKKLTQEDIRREVIALQDMGHKRLALEAGEDPIHNPIEYILESIKTIYSIKHKNGAIRRVNVNIAATTVENYRRLHEAGIGTYILFQETYPINTGSQKSCFSGSLQRVERILHNQRPGWLRSQCFCCCKIDLRRMFAFSDLTGGIDFIKKRKKSVSFKRPADMFPGA